MQFTDPVAAWNYLKQRIADWEDVPNQLSAMSDVATGMYDGYSSLWDAYAPYYGQGGALGGKANAVQARMNQAAADVQELQDKLNGWYDTDIQVHDAISAVTAALGWVMPGFGAAAVAWPAYLVAFVIGAATAVWALLEYIASKKLDLATKHTELIGRIRDGLADGTLTQEAANSLLQALDAVAQEGQNAGGGLPNPKDVGDAVSKIGTTAIILVALVVAMPLVTALAGRIPQRARA